MGRYWGTCTGNRACMRSYFRLPLSLVAPAICQAIGAYLLRALQSKGLAYQFHVEAKGVTRYGLSHAGIKSVWLPLPSLSEQTAIVQYLDEISANIETVITRMRRQIELFQEYRTRLIADVVTGKLDVREAAANLPNDTESMDDLQIQVYQRCRQSGCRLIRYVLR